MKTKQQTHQTKPTQHTLDIRSLDAIQAEIDSLPEGSRRKALEGANEIRGTVRRLGEPSGSHALALVVAELALEAPPESDHSVS
jgi:hypothetical protein